MKSNEATLKKISKLISSVKWTFAKTMPEIPHEHIVTDDYPNKRSKGTVLKTPSVCKNI